MTHQKWHICLKSSKKSKKVFVIMTATKCLQFFQLMSDNKDSWQDILLTVYNTDILWSFISRIWYKFQLTIGLHLVDPNHIHLLGDDLASPGGCGLLGSEKIQEPIPEPRHGDSWSNSWQTNLQEARKRFLWQTELYISLQSTGRSPDTKHPLE